MLLAAGTLPTSPLGKPRLELAAVFVAGGDGSPEAAQNARGSGGAVISQVVRLTLFNESERSLELSGPASAAGTGPWQARYWGAQLWRLEVVPAVTDAAGKAVVFEYQARGTDCLTAPPQTPDRPPLPLRPGERRVLEVFQVTAPSDSAPGAGAVLALGQSDPLVVGPSGQARLSPGHYRLQVSLDFQPVTRESWVASYIRFPPASAPPQSNRKGWEERLALQANHAADKLKAHWSAVDSYWTGHLDSNVVELEIR